MLQQRCDAVLCRSSRCGAACAGRPAGKEHVMSRRRQRTQIKTQFRRHCWQSACCDVTAWARQPRHRRASKRTTHCECPAMKRSRSHSTEFSLRGLARPARSLPGFEYADAMNSMILDEGVAVRRCYDDVWVEARPMETVSTDPKDCCRIGNTEEEAQSHTADIPMVVWRAWLCNLCQLQVLLAHPELSRSSYLAWEQSVDAPTYSLACSPWWRWLSQPHSEPLSAVAIATLSGQLCAACYAALEWIMNIDYDDYNDNDESISTRHKSNDDSCSDALYLYTSWSNSCF